MLFSEEIQNYISNLTHVKTQNTKKCNFVLCFFFITMIALCFCEQISEKENVIFSHGSYCLIKISKSQLSLQNLYVKQKTTFSCIAIDRFN